MYDDNYRLTDQPGQEIDVTGAALDAQLGAAHGGPRVAVRDHAAHPFDVLPRRSRPKRRRTTSSGCGARTPHAAPDDRRRAFIRRRKRRDLRAPGRGLAGRGSRRDGERATRGASASATGASSSRVQPSIAIQLGRAPHRRRRRAATSTPSSTTVLRAGRLQGHRRAAAACVGPDRSGRRSRCACSASKLQPRQTTPKTPAHRRRGRVAYARVRRPWNATCAAARTAPSAMRGGTDPESEQHQLQWWRGCRLELQVTNIVHRRAAQHRAELVRRGGGSRRAALPRRPRLLAAPDRLPRRCAASARWARSRTFGDIRDRDYVAASPGFEWRTQPAVLAAGRLRIHVPEVRRRAGRRASRTA